MSDIKAERRDLALAKARDVIKKWFNKEKRWDRMVKDLITLREAYRFPLDKWSKYEKVN